MRRSYSRADGLLPGAGAGVRPVVAAPGGFDRGPEANAQWFEEGRLWSAPWSGLVPGDVLELACGTGLWTRHLVGTPVGSPPLMPPTRYSPSIASDWPARGWTSCRPTCSSGSPSQGRMNVCFFGFWLSHVPRSALPRSGRRCAPPCDPMAGCSSLTVPRLALDRDPRPASRPDEEVMTRQLNDGREFRVVKRYYKPVRSSNAWLSSAGALRCTPRASSSSTVGRPPSAAAPPGN